MYIITENGDKLPVDNSTVDYGNGFHPWYQNVAVVDDDTAYLKDVWIVELQRYDRYRGKRNFEMEWFKDVKFNHEPSKDKIMAEIIKSGGDLWTIAFVRHGYELDRECVD